MSQVVPPMMLNQDDAQSRYDRFLETYLTGELKLVNAGLPRARKSLADLLEEEHPSVLCSDGTHQMLKRAELRYLQGILEDDEQRSLMLPMLIEMTGSGNDAIVLCPTNAESKVVAAVLGMEPRQEEPGRIRVYRPQLSVLRRKLKTTTQYAFSARALQ